MKKLIVSVMASAMIFTATAVSAQSMEDAVAKFSEAGELLQNKKVAEAIPLLEEAMSMAIDAGDDGLVMVKDIQELLPKVYLNKAAEELKAEKYDDALTTLAKAAELGELYGNTMIARQASRQISNIYMVQGVKAFNDKDYAAALEVFEKGYAEDPQNIKLALYTGLSYSGLQNFDKAVPVLKTVIDAGAANEKFAKEGVQAQQEIETAVLAAALSKVQEKDLDGAIELAELVIEATASPKAYMLPIQAANNLKKYSVVIERGESAAAAQADAEDKSDAYFMLGIAYQNAGNNAKAIEAYRKVTAGSSAAEAKKLISELNQ